MQTINVWTNGCFDVLHRGHIELFKYAKSLGDWLVVGIDSDQKVKKDKGPRRPYNCLADRLEMLNAIRYIDEVCVFHNTLGLSNLIKHKKPDIMVIGSDWKGKTVVGSEHCKELKFFDRINGYSTTKILENER